MNGDSKYIVFEDEGLLVPVIFPNHLVHADMAKYLQRLGKPVSAGFVGVSENNCDAAEAFVHGESISLKLKPHERDNRLINELLNTAE